MSKPKVQGSLLTFILSPKGLCHNPYLSLRATEGSMAISLFSRHYEIASVVSLPRNDITTQSLRGERFSHQSLVGFKIFFSGLLNDLFRQFRCWRTLIPFYGKEVIP